MISKLAALHITVRLEDVPAFIEAAGLAGWSAVDSGERVTTEEGYAKEAVLVVRIPHFVEAKTATTH